MDIFESSVFKSRKRHLIPIEHTSLIQEIEHIARDPKNHGQVRPDIHPEIYCHFYEDPKGRKILSYRLLSDTKIVLLSIDRISLKL